MPSPKAQAISLPVARDSELLAAIVENSDDAILTKNLDGIITSWNSGAQRLFGYTADEIVGRPILALIPPNRHDEEPRIIDRIRRGERVDHFETIRLRKDGAEVHISLTISPLRDEEGRIVGASKIARDISERVRAQEMQRLLLGEMQHRIKNVFALAGSLVSLSAGRAGTPAELARMVRARLRALAAAHELTVPSLDDAALRDRQSTVHALLRVLLAPSLDEGDDERLRLSGPDPAILPRAITPFALVLNELMTNAVKHGALRDYRGRIAVTTALDGPDLVIVWAETHPEPPGPAPEAGGFGSTLSRIAVEQQLSGSLTREWTADGLTVTIRCPRADSLAPE